MNRLEKWLLRRLLRKDEALRHEAIAAMWERSKYRFYEDNVFDRYDFFVRQLDSQFQADLRRYERGTDHSSR